MKEQVTKITNNIPGTLIGAGVVYFGVKKFANVENKWVLIGLTVVGGLAGAMVQAKMKAKAGAPTAEIVLGGKK
jgi:F0F1-type ATP synthase assembly protein I